MRIKARFIGTDSLGYKTGQEYVLDLRGMTAYPLDMSAKPCPYASIPAFLRNWEILEIVD